MDNQHASIPERLSLDDVILGLVSDLKGLRAGTVSVRDARARADLGREILRGVRLVIEAQKFMEGHAKQIPSAPEPFK